MKPIRHTKSARFYYLKMYREELDQLVGFFREACNGLTISDSKNRYESLDEMQSQVGSRVKELDIQGDNPAVHFLLNKTEIVFTGTSPSQATFHELRTEEITDAADNLFYRVGEFLTAQQQPRFRQPGLTVSILLGIVFLLLCINNKEGSGSNATIRYSPGLIASLIGALIFLLGSINSSSHLSLKTKRDSPSFFAKNREDFAKQGIIAIISGLVGWLLGHFLK